MFIRCAMSSSRKMCMLYSKQFNMYTRACKCICHDLNTNNDDDDDDGDDGEDAKCKRMKCLSNMQENQAYAWKLACK